MFYGWAHRDTEEWQDIPKNIPIVMGEFGCNINWYPNATACAPNVRQLQISSCAAGFTGWLFWCGTNASFLRRNATLTPRIFAKIGSRQTQDKLVEKERRFCRTYDSNDVQPDWYGMIDDNGAIDAVLAPKTHPDPCKMPAQ